MNEIFKSNVTCPHCKNKFFVNLIRSVNVNAAPDLKKKILSGRFFNHTCPICGENLNIQHPLLYMDYQKKIIISYCQADSFNNEVNALNQFSKDFTRRIVLSDEDLMEKIRIFDENLDDRVIELAKMGVIKAQNIDGIFWANLIDRGPSIVFFSGQTACGSCSVPNEFINDLKQKFSDKIAAAENTFLIDFNWACSDDSKDQKLNKISYSAIYLLDDPVFVSAYESLQAKQKKDFFHEDINEAAGIVDSFLMILGKKIGFKKILEIYITINVRIKLFQYSEVQVRKTLLKRYPDINANEDFMLYEYVARHMTDPNYYITNEAQLNQLETLLETAQKKNRKRKELSNPSSSTYGLSPNNPILQTGLRDAHELLQNLEYEDGEILSYKRVGIVESEMPDIVDCFAIEIKPKDGSLGYIINMFFDGYAEEDPGILPARFHRRMN